MLRTLQMLREALLKLLQHRFFIPFCLICGVLLRLLWIWLIDAEQVSDYKWYYQRALGIAGGRGYSVDGIPTAYWPAGYPGFLGMMFTIFGPSLLLAKLLNIVLYMATAVLMYVFSKRIFNSDSAAKITLLILTFYPNHIAYTSLLSTEILFAFLLSLGAVLFLASKARAGLLVVAGMCWGMATLTKPQAVFVPILFILVFIGNMKSRLRAGVIIYSMLLLTVVPWMYRNYLVLGKPLLSTNGGIVLLIGNNPYAIGRQIWDENVKSLLGDLGTDNMFDGKEVEREVRATDVALSFIVHNPAQTIMLFPKKLAALYLSDVEGIYYSVGMMKVRWNIDPLLWTLRVVGELYYVTVILLFLVSIPGVLHNRAKGSQISIIMIMYFTIVYLVCFGNARYHFAIMFWVALNAGIGGARVLNLSMELPFTSEQSGAGRMDGAHGRFRPRAAVQAGNGSF